MRKVIMEIGIGQIILSLLARNVLFVKYRNTHKMRQYLQMHFENSYTFSGQYNISKTFGILWLLVISGGLIVLEYALFKNFIIWLYKLNY